MTITLKIHIDDDQLNKAEAEADQATAGNVSALQAFIWDISKALDQQGINNHNIDLIDRTDN